MTLIVFIGPDGCGKTTIAESLSDRANDHGISVSSIRNTNFGIIPEAKIIRRFWARLRRREFHDIHAHEDGEVNAGMRHPPNSTVRGTCLLLWYAMDFVLGWFEVIGAQLTSRILIFTRYYQDYYYQRAHKNVPALLVRAIEKVIPYPDTIFYLRVDPERVLERKAELSIEEIARQNKAIEAALHGRPNVITLNGNQPVAELVDIVWDTLTREK